ncbi:abhydrolase domain-containing 18 [Acidobacteria bacterium AH-259-D05]|nr:abhydrolase domain-containing 18 [Acidobacteria bacterium AH-259-D05]
MSSLKNYAGKILKDSDSYYQPPPLKNCVLKDDILTLNTPTPSPYRENNTVYCHMFTAPGSETAVIVVPQWNAGEDSHVGLCRLLKRLGITAARLCMPYHEQRLPSEMQRADYMVSPNIGRTLHATRQAVLEVRQIAVWLKEQGFQRIAVMGTSVGSCISYLAFVHDPSICTGVFNHVSSFFADVVWTGLSTRYIRWGLEGNISLEDLRQCWAPISPWFYVNRLKTGNRPHLLITAKYDLTFRPELTEKVFEEYETHKIPHQRVELPCGHYTSARFPFKYLDGWHMCRYLVRQLT